MSQESRKLQCALFLVLARPSLIPCAAEAIPLFAAAYTSDWSISVELEEQGVVGAAKWASEAAEKTKERRKVVCILVLECIGCGNCCRVHEWYGSLICICLPVMVVCSLIVLHHLLTSKLAQF